jgi:ubiquinone/menaquinone biosynthesis C-methylase UbiE
MSTVEPQVQSAQRMYDARAANYEESWHPNYSKRFIELCPLNSGQRVLDLCCGTGLDAFLAAEIVGDQGQVICVDVSDGSKLFHCGSNEAFPAKDGHLKARLMP